MPEPPTARYRSSLAIGAILLLVAGVLSVQSIRASLAWAVPRQGASLLSKTIANGLLRERLAVAALSESRQGEGSSTSKWISAEALSLAQSARAREPLTSEALALLAMGAAQTNGMAKARQLIDRAAWMSKRNGIATLWLIEDLAAQGKADAVLVQYDKLLRTAVASRPMLLPVLVSALEDPTLLEPISRALGDDVPWSDDFWTTVATTPSSLAYGAKLRARVKDKVVFNKQRDGLLFEALGRQKLFEEAQTLHAAIVPQIVAPEGEMLKNHSFAREPLGGPVDWQLYSSSDFGASVSAADGLLAISSIDRGGGTVARQIVHLAPGEYRARATLQAGDGAFRSPVSIALSCQTGVGASNFAWPLTRGGNHKTFTILGGCDYYFVDVVVASNARGGVDASLDEVSIRKF